MKRAKLIKEILHDEKTAPRDYYKLKSKVSLKSDKKKIVGIIHDEKRHYKIIKKLKSKYK